MIGRAIPLLCAVLTFSASALGAGKAGRRERVGKEEVPKLVLEETEDGEQPPAKPAGIEKEKPKEEDRDEEPQEEEPKEEQEEKEEEPKEEGTEEPQEEQDAEPERTSTAPQRPWARFWLGVSGSLEFVALPVGEDLCRLSPGGEPANDVGAYCTNPGGSDFPSRTNPAENAAIPPGGAGALDGKITSGNARILASFDYAPIPTLLVGARLGYVLNAYPGTAAPGGFPAIHRNLHAELRGTYLFGGGVLAATGFVPLAFLAAGAAEFDGYVRRIAITGGVNGQRPVQIWVVGGPWFLGLGGGARYHFSPRAALSGALRLNAALGGPATLFTFGPEVGVAYGF